jgi:copper(I)-binding protein
MFRIHMILSCVLLAVPALADGGFRGGDAPAASVGGIELRAPMIRATPPNAPVAGGYLVVTNAGEADDLLVGASVPAEIAARAELHEMEMVDGVMRMAEVEGGIPLPAGETVTLMPGGLHVMLMGLAEGLEAGDMPEVTLTFERAGDVTLPFAVRSIGEVRAFFEGPDDAHDGHTHMGH